MRCVSLVTMGVVDLRRGRFVLVERCSKLSDKKVLAASLALSAGVMLYVFY